MVDKVSQFYGFVVDIKLAIGWNRLYLGFAGIWPEPTLSNRTANCKSLINTIFILVFVSAPQCANLFLLNGNLELITENLSLANIPATGAALKIIFTWCHREDLKRVIKSIYEDWYGVKTEEERTTMLKNARASRYISIVCTVMSQIMLFIYLCLRAIAVTTLATSDQITEKQDRLLLYPGYFPYNVRPTPVLILTNLGQVAAVCCATTSYTSVDVFIVMLVFHTCGQFENLRRRLERLMDGENGICSVDQIQKELVWIVKRHEHLSWMAKKIDHCFNILLLILMLFSTVMICFQGFIFFNMILHGNEGLFSVTFLFLVLFVLFIVVHIYLYCYVSEMLLVQSIGMSNSAYNANWFHAAPQKAKCLLLIMHRCSRPLCLSAGKFGIFSMELFSSILKTSVGYLSVLLTVSKDD